MLIEHPPLEASSCPYWPIPDFAQMAYLTLQAVLGLETLWQWPLEMYKAVPKV